ncbi:extracellular solute-binding protein [Paenibacillus sp. CC-CFT747]|nr:extracellular solute-binding protein [Paenibacillus sp. CC-CFT747]
MRRPIVKAIAILVVISIIIYSSTLLAGGGSAARAEAVDRPLDVSGLQNMKGSVNPGSYDAYIARYSKDSRPEKDIVIQGEDFDKAEGISPTFADDLGDGTRRAVLTGETGSIEWTFQVPETGLYNIEISYYNVKGKDSDMERELAIDGELPFAEARSFVFSRVWKDATQKVVQDDNGNDIIPDQAEEPMWQSQLLRDSNGYYSEPYLFYFSKGTHRLKLTSAKESMAIDSIKLTNPPGPPSYKDLMKTYIAQGYQPADQVLIKIQGEQAAYKSSQTLVAYNDRSDPANEPFSVSKLRNNAGGGYSWRMPGQWIEWEVDVPKDGLYQIAFKNHQNYLRGMSSLRRLYIDGRLPFAEANRIGFPYSSDWQFKIIGEGADNPYSVYLAKGKHKIRLEVTLDDLAPILRATQASILQLNNMYRQIISYTSTTPDQFRDYQLEERIPHMVPLFREQSSLLDKIASIIEGSSGKSNENSALLHTLAYQLKDMAAKPETVPSRLESFKGNVGALGSWLLTLPEQPLAIDYLIVSTPGAKLPSPTASGWGHFRSSTQSFFASFYEKYDQFSGEDDGGKSITVWMTSARDQVQVMKRLIDNEFTPKTGTNVKLRLIGADVVLPATLAGKGPDIALQMGNDTPVNFASRGALVDLSKFADFGQVKERFLPSAIVPYEYGGGVYGMPEQQTFPMLFYRKDILDELHLKVPQTWEEVYTLIPELQKHHLEFGLEQKPLDMMGNEVVTSNALPRILLLR